MDKAAAARRQADGGLFQPGGGLLRVKQYDAAWSDVNQGESLGGRPDPNFLSKLTRASGGRPE